MGADERSVSDLLGTVILPVEEGVPNAGIVTEAAARERQASGAEVVEGETAHASENAADAVPFVYVPVQPRKPGNNRNTVMFELRSIDGEAGLAVYTSQDRLVAELGEHQPHARIPVLHLLVRLARETLPIAVDPVLEPG